MPAGIRASTAWNTTTNLSWSDATNPGGLRVEDLGAGGIAVSGTWDSRAETTDATTTPAITLPTDEPVLLEMQVCLAYTNLVGTQCTWASQPITVQRMPEGFAAGGPIAPAGPGEVNLISGDFSMGVVDASVPGWTGSLQVGRTHTTDLDAGTTAGGVFGPGWVSEFDADLGTGAALVDSTHVDGTLQITDAAGAVVAFQAPDGRRVDHDTDPSAAPLTDGAYTPVIDDGDEFVGTIVVSGGGTTAVYTDPDGFETEFGAVAVPAAGVPAVFALRRAADTGAPVGAGETRYVRDSAGRITRVVAAVPDAQTTCALPTDPTVAWVANGCRALHLVYATVSAPGNPTRLVQVWASLGDAALAEKLLVSYGYDATGRLATAKDELTGLTTQYSYVVDGNSTRLATVTPPGQSPISFVYTGTGISARLSKVTRPRPAGDPTGGTATLASFLYDVPITNPALPKVTPGDVAKWGQLEAPSYAAAVFGPAYPAPAGTPTAADWQHASLVYTDKVWGHTLNTAVYGAGDWQLTAVDYDSETGNPRRELDTRAMALLANDPDNVVSDGAGADQLATQTEYNKAILDPITGAELEPAGMVVVDVYGPARWATTADGRQAWIRPHVHTDYDQNAPGGSPIDPATGFHYWLPTTATTSAFDPGNNQDEVVSVVRNGYGTVVAGDPSGWELGAATTSTVDMPGTIPDVVRSTRYDAQGRVIETRQPMSNGADTGTRRTVYYGPGSAADYSGDAAAAKANCAWTPWIGLPCRTSSGDGPSSVLATTTVTYTALLAPDIMVEKAAGATRTTTVLYDSAGRPRDVTVAAAGLTGSTPVNAARTKYDATTGLPTELVQLAAGAETTTKQTTSYDAWGRIVSYTPSGGGLTTTSYDAAGRVSSKIDPNGTTTWAYGGTDANGIAETRGSLPTGMTVTNPGGAPVAFTAAYDATGALVKQTLPGGLVQNVVFDAAGGMRTLEYRGQVVNGDGSIDPQGVWLGWEAQRDVAGRVRREWTPEGAAFTTAVGDAIAYDRQYAYDAAGRLVQVDDRTAAGTDVLGANPDDPNSLVAACQTRIYDFDANGNRIGLIRRQSSGACATTGGSPTNWTYSSADRLLTGANGTGTYSYDQLGRVTTVPAVDTPKGTGDLTIGYYDTDAARSIAQAGPNGQTTTYGMDVAGRRLTATSGPTGRAVTGTLTRHYTDESDNPGWVTNTTGSGTVVTRYAGSLGPVNASISGTAVSLPLTDPHGDNVTTVTIPTAGNASTIDAWSDTDEYGNAANPTAAKTVGGPTGYGWLGDYERGTDDSGLTLMGARLYNPATAQFTSIDPVYVGNDTAYNYPNDPVNEQDASGLRKYHLHYDLGPMASDIKLLMTELRLNFKYYFVIPGRADQLTHVGQEMNLYIKAGSVKKGFPVRVSRLTATSWRFDTRRGHPDYPGYIEFKFSKDRNGHAHLEIIGSIPLFDGCWYAPASCQAGWQGYIVVARKTWGPFAENLRGLVDTMNYQSGRR